MNYKVSFYKKPPKGMSLTENEDGYTIYINSVDWNIFVLWAILVGLVILLIVVSILHEPYLPLFFAAILTYFVYLLSTFVFIRAKLVLEENAFRLYSFQNMLFRQKPYEINLSQISSIRLISMGAGSSEGGTWHQTGSVSIEFVGYTKNYNDEIAVYRKDYTIFVCQFLKEYIKLLK